MAGIDSYTKLCLHCNGTDGSSSFPDSSPSNHIMTAQDNFQVDTAQYKFGGASGLSDGTSDYVSTPDDPDWLLGTVDWTWDGWYRFNDVSTQQGLWQIYKDSDNFIGVYLAGAPNDVLNFIFKSGGTVKADYSLVWSPLTNTWYHIEVSRSGAGILIFTDGTKGSPTENTAIGANSIPNFTGTFDIARCYQPSAGLRTLNGWVDEFRFSAGICRHTNTFTPPTSQYTRGGGSRAYLIL